jgi:hypothetical protein
MYISTAKTLIALLKIIQPKCLYKMKYESKLALKAKSLNHF